jgi:hypothetical protein
MKTSGTSGVQGTTILPVRGGQAAIALRNR